MRDKCGKGLGGEKDHRLSSAGIFYVSQYDGL